ncbi:MAG: DUF2161 family putative PD-(D/E)XK-type phosphodiesterase [Bacillota bacterium]|jgi:hypothetical protein|nr:DUF2161 family putative PD-(D/E)XK-type phosphodiesterase [Bacillota bacterium]NLV62610.1 hypothetical protein [Clostridiaceae bacterium]
MEKTGKILEKDLYWPVHNYFKKLGYDVHGEVKDCDITASKGDELIIIELKRNLSIDLLIQAAKRQRITESVYIAIPKPKYSVYTKKWKDLCFIIRRLELGLITISLKNGVEQVNVVFEPYPFDRRKSMRLSGRKRRNIISEIDGRHGNYNVGGSTRTEIMTAYRENAVHIACCLKKYGQLSPRKLRELGTGEKTQSILSKNFYGWFEKVEKGIYKLSDRGHEVFGRYPELSSYYSDMVKDKENA